MLIMVRRAAIIVSFASFSPAQICTLIFFCVYWTNIAWGQRKLLSGHKTDDNRMLHVSIEQHCQIKLYEPWMTGPNSILGRSLFAFLSLLLCNSKNQYYAIHLAILVCTTKQNYLRWLTTVFVLCELWYTRALPKARKNITRVQKSREPAEEIPRAQKQNGGSRKNFLVFQVGFRGVLTVARLCLGLITKKKVLSNGCRSLTALKALQSCDFVPNVWTRRHSHVLTSWSARTVKLGVFPEQACAMVFSPEVAITIFSCLISPNLAVQPVFKFLLLTESTKTET